MAGCRASFFLSSKVEGALGEEEGEEEDGRRSDE